jgi:hypothetical protein
MNWQKNRLWIGALAFAALLGASYFVIQKRRDEGGAPAGSAAAATLPEIDRNELDALEIRRPSLPPIRLAKSGSGWRLTAPLDAAIDMTTLNAALDKLDTLEVTGTAATNRANHARLEVTPETGIRVLATKGSTTVADLWIGAFRGGATMVRVEGQDRVFSVEGSIQYAFKKDVKEWRDREITNVEPDDVVAIRFEGPKGTYSFTKSDSDWRVDAGSAAIERFAPSKLVALVQSAARLRATDFANADVTAEQHGFETPEATTITFRTAGEAGTQEVALRIGKASGSGDREFFARRVGVDTVYVISSYLANRLAPDAEALSTPADGGAPAAAPEPPPGMGAMGGPGGMPGAGQLPPELMQQIQQQLRAQQAQQAAGGH